jgi:hypothetical protein
LSIEAVGETTLNEKYKTSNFIYANRQEKIIWIDTLQKKNFIELDSIEILMLNSGINIIQCFSDSERNYISEKQRFVMNPINQDYLKIRK